MKRVTYVFSAAALAGFALAAQPALAFGAEEAVEVEETKAKKPKKIKDRNHPDYVRCRSEPIIGSLARKRRICMTNREWVEMARKGNERTREVIDENQLLVPQN